MAKVLHQGASGTISRAASATGYGRLIGNGRHTISSGESNRTTLWRTSGVLSNLYINILTNDRAASTFRTRIGTSNANLVVSITGSTTGKFEDTSNTDAVTAGEDWHTQLVTGAGGTVFTYDVDSVLFEANTNTVHKIGGGDGGSETAASATQPIPPYGNSVSSAVADSDVGQTMRTAGTLKNLYLYTNANARTTTTTFRSRVNSNFGNMTLSVTAGATGSFEDTSNTDTIAEGDLVNFSITTGTGTETLALSGITAEFETTNSKAQYTCGTVAGSTVNAAVTTYYALAGFLSSSTTEANKTIESNLAFTASLLQCNVTANTVNETSTVKFRKNAADGNQVVTITGLTTGVFQDVTNSDSVVATDAVDYQVTAGATGTSIVLRSISVLGAMATNVTFTASPLTITSNLVSPTPKVTTISTAQAISASLQTPTEVIKPTIPAQSISGAVVAPTEIISPAMPAQTASFTLQAPTLSGSSSKTVIVGALTMSIQVIAPTPGITIKPEPLSMTVSLEQAEKEVKRTLLNARLASFSLGGKTLKVSPDISPLQAVFALPGVTISGATSSTTVQIQALTMSMILCAPMLRQIYREIAISTKHGQPKYVNKINAVRRIAKRNAGTSVTKHQL